MTCRCSPAASKAATTGSATAGTGAAWAHGSPALVGLCFVNLPGQFVGPLGELAGGIDLSLPVTLGLAGVLYLILLNLFPEPAGVYGPQGPRWVRCSTPVKPVTTAEMA
jgi:purine-cytosine permease-like protein